MTNRPKLGINKLPWMTRRVRQAQIVSAGEFRTVIERERAIVDPSREYNPSRELAILQDGNSALVIDKLEHSRRRAVV